MVVIFSPTGAAPSISFVSPPSALIGSPVLPVSTVSTGWKGSTPTDGIDEINANGWTVGVKKFFSPLPSVLPSSSPPPPPHRHRRHCLHRTCTISGTSCVVSLILITPERSGRGLGEESEGAHSPFLARSAGAEGSWGEGEGQPSPPAPLPHCGRGEDLVDGLGIVERRRRRIATLPPFLARSAGEEGGWGEGEGCQPYSAAPTLNLPRRRIRCLPAFP